MRIAKKFNHEIAWTALTGACAIDAVGVPYLMRRTKFVWLQMLYFFWRYWSQ
jgi:hypothetical protein